MYQCRAMYASSHASIVNGQTFAGGGQEAQQRLQQEVSPGLLGRLPMLRDQRERRPRFKCRFPGCDKVPIAFEIPS